MTRFVLFLIGLLGPFLRLMKVDSRKVRAIVSMKLTTDNRSVPLTEGDAMGKDRNNTFYKWLVAYVFLGGGMSVAIFVADRAMLPVTLFHSFLMVMAAMSIIINFSTVLLDTRDNGILLPLPVDGRTLAAARFLHVFTYILLINGAYSFIATVAVFFSFGVVAGAVFMLTVFLNALLVLLGISLFYLVAARIASKERMRGLVSATQIGMTLFILVGYQAVNHAITADGVLKGSYDIDWWMCAVPSAWFGSLVDLSTGQSGGGPPVLMSVLSLAIPLLGGAFTVKMLGSGFERTLMKMDLSGSSPQKDSLSDKLSRFFSGLLFNSPTSRGSFEFVWKMSSREHKFKQRVYPGLVYSLVVPWAMGAYLAASPWETVAFMQQSQLYLAFLYSGVLFVSLIPGQIRYADHARGSWIYQIALLQPTSKILFGSLAAVIVKHLMPVFLLNSVVALLIWGGQVIPHIAVALPLCVFTISLIAAIDGRGLPFSAEHSSVTGNTIVSRMFLFTGLPLMVAGAHYFWTDLEVNPWLLLPPSILAAALYFFLFTRVRLFYR